MADQYHHGDLRRAFLARTADEVAHHGVHAVSLRALAAAEGVSHAAPRHHFGSREGLLTALAAEGYARLAEALRARREAGGSFADLGVTYVEFAESHPGHFAVMFDPDLLVSDDEELRQAERRAFAELVGGVDRVADATERRDRAAATVAAWALVHGLAELHRSGALDRCHVIDLLGRPTVTELAGRAVLQLRLSPESAS